ncbi:MAG: flagellar assembly protein FliW [Actinobacteria bacterium]|nr:flagellar assembly protein FliW [Actinomycetota bacterium]
MPITIQSSRFGAIELPDSAAIEFPSGLIGLPGTRWALIGGDGDSDFRWLHSLEDPTLALPVVQPWLFFPGYEVVLSDTEAQRIGVTDAAEAEVYVTVRAAAELADFRANLRAPLVVRAGRGYQVINEAPDAPVRATLFAELAEAPAEPQVA